MRTSHRVARDVRSVGVLVTQLPQKLDQAEFNLSFVEERGHGGTSEIT